VVVICVTVHEPVNVVVKHAINNADKVFNEELFDYCCSKDDVSFFWRAWRKRYCSSSVKNVNTINGKHGDDEMCRIYRTVPIDRCSKVKYLGLYLISGIHFRIDLNAAKQKYYGCFNNIKSVIRKQTDEIMLLKLIKTYCLPRLLYGCDIWPTVLKP